MSQWKWLKIKAAIGKKTRTFLTYKYGMTDLEGILVSKKKDKKLSTEIQAVPYSEGGKKK